MQKVLFIPAPVLSHLKVSFIIANLLKKNQYDIHYYTFHGAAPLVTQNHFPCSTGNTTPIMEGYRKALAKLENVKLGYWEHLRNGAMQSFFNDRRKEVIDVVNKVKPDIIIADMFAAADFAFLYPLLKERDIRFFQLETLPCNLTIKGVPAFHSGRLPVERRKIWLEQTLHRWNKRTARFKESLAFFGKDTYSLLKKELRRNRVPRQYGIEKRNLFSLSFTNLPTLVTLPLELEFFEAPPTPHHYYLGFVENGTGKSVAAVPDNRLDRLLQSDKRIIYISFGTVFAGAYTPLIITFLQKLDTVLASLENTVAIFSQGKPPGTPSTPMPTFSHIHTFNYVPQGHVLRHCSIFITHGGINSIKESIQATVPMLVLPLDVDQPGNAAKMMHKQLGLAGHIMQETVESLKDKIALLLSNPQYKAHMERFRDAVNQDYDVEHKLLSLIETVGVVN